MLLRVKPVLTFMIAALVFFFVAEFISFKVLSGGRYPLTWRGYYQIVCPPGNTYNDVENLLEKNGFKGIISEKNEKVSVFSFSKPLKIPLSEVSGYYVPSDPLYDPYLKKINGYFNGFSAKKPVKVLYLPVRTDPFRTYITLKRVLEPVQGRWTFVDFMPIEKSMLLLLILTGEFVLFKLSGDKKIYFITLVSWCFSLIFGDFFTVIMSMSCQFLWILLFNRFIPFFTAYLNYTTVNKDEITRMIVESALYVGIYISLLIDMHGVIKLKSLFLPQTAQIFATAVVLGFLFIQHRFRAHKLFSPVLIKERWKCLKFNEVYAVAVFLVLFITAPFFYWISFGGKNITLPAPYSVIGNIPISYSTLQKMDTLKSEDVLPDLSDYLAHKAFLESYMYGGSFTFPAEGSAVTLSIFQKKGILAQRKNSIIKLFTDSWYNRIISSVNNATVPGLLLKQGVPFGVKFTNVIRLSHGKGNLRRYYLFFVFLVLPFLFWAGVRFTSPGSRFKRLFLRRRRQVV